MTLNLIIAGADTELGQETTRQFVARGYSVTGLSDGKDGATAIRSQGGLPADASLTNAAELKQVLQTSRAEVVLNLTPQFPNTLLNDGQDWKDFDKMLSDSTAALLEAIKNVDIKLLIHTSYAFLYGNVAEATEDTALNPPNNDPIFQAAIAAENQVKASGVTACILRLGYLYGPQSEDLKLYEKSFKLGRPYYAGPSSNLGNWLHFEDAAQALVQVVEQQPIAAVFNVVDGTPVSFADFIDHFALTLGRKRPRHIPMWMTALARILVIKQQQVELLKLATRVKSDRFCQQLGWSPHYASYREGLQQTVQTWRANNQ